MSPLLPQGKVVLASQRIGTSHVWWLVPLNPAIQKAREEDQEFKGILCYIVSLRLAWNTLYTHRSIPIDDPTFLNPP